MQWHFLLDIHIYIFVYIVYTYIYIFALYVILYCCKSQEIIISKTEGERLGMHIKGGLNGQRGNPLDPTDEGVFVSKINSVGAARRDGRLKVGLIPFSCLIA